MRPVKVWFKEDRPLPRTVAVEDTSWEQVERALRLVDGERCSSAGIEIGSGEDALLMAISGGRDDRIVCSIAEPEAPDGPRERFLLDPDQGSGVFAQPIGGAATELPARWSVTREQAIEAARHFLDHDGAAHPDLEWEEV